jgi:hypothetical protein
MDGTDSSDTSHARKRRLAQAQLVTRRTGAAIEARVALRKCLQIRVVDNIQNLADLAVSTLIESIEAILILVSINMDQLTLCTSNSSFSCDFSYTDIFVSTTNWYPNRPLPVADTKRQAHKRLSSRISCWGGTRTLPRP